MYDKSKEEYVNLQGRRVPVVLLLSVLGNRVFNVHRLSGRKQGSDESISGWLGEDDIVIFWIRLRGVLVSS